MNVRSMQTILAVLKKPTHRQVTTLGQLVRCLSNKLGNKPVDYLNQSDTDPRVSSALPITHSITQVLFDNSKTANFENIWLRDNCMCPKCVDKVTKQKLLDTPSLDPSTKPESIQVTNAGNNLEISWRENEQDHITTFGSSWLYQYGQCFINDTFEYHSAALHPDSAPVVLWDRARIWKELPEVGFNQFMETDNGLRTWLEMVHKYGIAILRNVPPVHGQLIDVVKRFAYVKETQYGLTFDVVNKADPTAHPAYSGLHLHHHTDMNYRETSPGLQLLHCLKANNSEDTSSDPGGMSFFVDGFRVAKWLEDCDPASFHMLTSTPVRFQIQNNGKQYSQLFPIICVNSDGDITEIHCNNRTMQTLQVPSYVVGPFYHAYKVFTEKIRSEKSEMRFQMQPGDLVAFNNRRVLHGRTSFDATKVNRHLIGCYADFDEVVAAYNSFLEEN